MYSFSTDNGFVKVNVCIEDLQVYNHVKRYLGISNETCDEGMHGWKIEAYNRVYHIPNIDKPIGEIKGEYGEKILEYRDDCLVRLNCANNSVIKFVSPNYIQIFNSAKEGLFIDTYRAIRQILIHDLIHRGSPVIHSSSICYKGNGYLFVGPKGAGKTTAVFQYLCSDLENVCYGSNERNILFQKDGEIWAYGWLGVAFVGVGTIKSTIGLEKLRNMHEKSGGTAFWLSEHQLLSPQFLNYLIALGDDAYKIKDKIWMTTNEIGYLTNRKICNKFKIKGIVFPKFLPDTAQHITASNKDISSELITDLNFFNDWLNINSRTKSLINNRYKLYEAINNVSKLDISGANLVADLELEMI